jgi:hypothetical protein
VNDDKSSEKDISSTNGELDKKTEENTDETESKTE